MKSKAILQGAETRPAPPATEPGKPGRVGRKPAGIDRANALRSTMRALEAGLRHLASRALRAISPHPPYARLVEEGTEPDARDGHLDSPDERAVAIHPAGGTAEPSAPSPSTPVTSNLEMLMDPRSTRLAARWPDLGDRRCNYFVADAAGTPVSLADANDGSKSSWSLLPSRRKQEARQQAVGLVQQHAAPTARQLQTLSRVATPEGLAGISRLMRQGKVFELDGVPGQPLDGQVRQNVVIRRTPDGDLRVRYEYHVSDPKYFYRVGTGKEVVRTRLQEGGRAMAAYEVSISADGELNRLGEIERDSHLQAVRPRAAASSEGATANGEAKPPPSTVTPRGANPALFATPRRKPVTAEQMRAKRAAPEPRPKPPDRQPQDKAAPHLLNPARRQRGLKPPGT